MNWKHLTPSPTFTTGTSIKSIIAMKAPIMYMSALKAKWEVKMPMFDRLLRSC